MGFRELFPNLVLGIMSGPLSFLTIGKNFLVYVLLASGSTVVIITAAYGLITSYNPTQVYLSYIPSQEILQMEISEAVSDILEGQLKIDITEERLNQLLHAYIVEEINPDYDPVSGCSGDFVSPCQLIASGPIGFNDVELGVNAIWITLLDNQFILNVAISESTIREGGAARLAQQNFVARMYFNVTNKADVFEVEFDRLQTGFLPIPVRFFVNILSPSLERNGLPLTMDGSNGLSYSINELNLKINKQEFIAENIDNELLANYASLIVSEDLVQIIVDEESKEIRLFVDQERLYTQTSIPLIPGSVELVTALYLQDIIDSGSFSIGDLFN